VDSQSAGVEPIGKATVLHGHVSPDTAYLVEDYPCGRASLRCRIRYWVDTAKWGAKRGQRRFVLQTTNPKVLGEPWNKPHPGGYSLLVWMYLDSEDHVRHATFDKYGITPSQDAWLRLTGIYDQIPPSDQEIYDGLLQNAKRNPDAWQQWATAIALIADHIEAAGTPPALDNGFVVRNEQYVYVGRDDYSLAVAIARRRGR
jgi:hypothetical protein